MDIEAGNRFKQLYKDKGLTQESYSKSSGVSQQHISDISRGKQVNLGSNTIEKLARPLGIKPERLLSILKGTDKITTPTLTHADYVELVRLSAPVSIPVYDSIYFHAGKGSHLQAVDSVVLERSVVSSRNLEAYVVHGSCLEPAIIENDVIVVDSDAAIDTGNFVACQHEDRFVIGKLKVIADEQMIENGHGNFPARECSKIARIVQIVRKL